jgi:hypothetical protein
LGANDSHACRILSSPDDLAYAPKILFLEKPQQHRCPVLTGQMPDGLVQTWSEVDKGIRRVVLERVHLSGLPFTRLASAHRRVHAGAKKQFPIHVLGTW